MKLIATKPFSYNTRRLLPGDIFETKSDQDGKLLIGIRKAREIQEKEETTVPAPKPELANLISNDRNLGASSLSDKDEKPTKPTRTRGRKRKA